MAKRAAAAVLAAIFIFPILISCEPKASDPLAYQGSPAHVEAVAETDTGTFRFTAELAGSGGTIRITHPETLAGMEVRASGASVEITADGLTLPVSEAASERWREIFALFALDPNGISSVEESGGSVTVGVGTSADRVFVRFDGGASVPSQIRTVDGTLTVNIEKYELSTDETGGT